MNERAGLRDARSRLFSVLAERLSSAKDLPGLFQGITSSLHPVLQHEFSQLLLFDEATGWLKNHGAYFPHGKGLIREGTLVPVDGSPAGWVFKTKQPLLMERPDEVREANDIVDRLLMEGVKSGCCVPLMFRDDCLGVFSVGSSHEAAFTEIDQDLLSAVGKLLGIVVADILNLAKLDTSQAELAQRHSRIQMLLEINNTLVTKLEIRELFAEISASLRRVTHHAYSQIVLYDTGLQQLAIRAVDFPGGRGLIREGIVVPPEAPAGSVFAKARPLLIEELKREDYPSEVTDQMLAEGVRSVCLTPLVSHNRVLGVLSIGRGEGPVFTTEELEVLVAVGNQAAIAVENALAVEQISELNRRLLNEKVYLEEEVRATAELANIIGNSAALRKVLKQAQIAAPTDATVLLTGETGTGKELIARAIHEMSARKNASFIKLNCSAIPTGLLESELFGHEKGAFTGALTKKIGRLELADKGTLFLDEIGDLPLELQPKLLRVLQDGEFERLGATKTIRSDVRIVAATNRDLPQMIAASDFREDLYYRLKVFPIVIPPLRKRSEDIPHIVRYFVEKYSRQMKKKIDRIPAAVMQDLASWSWPGNVRELQNFLQRAVILSQGTVLQIPTAELRFGSEDSRTPRTTLADVEREHILKILRESKGIIGSAQGAAAKLGLKRTTLNAKMRKLGIKRQDFMP